MKSALFAVVLAATISVPAIAQDTMQPPATGAMSAPANDMAAPPASTAPMGADSTAPADSTMPADPAQAPTTQSAMPSTDGSASSAPADMGTASPGGAMTSNAPAAGDPSTYPVCSRTVKDRCINPSAKTRKRRG